MDNNGKADEDEGVVDEEEVVVREGIEAIPDTVLQIWHYRDNDKELMVC